MRDKTSNSLCRRLIDLDQSTIARQASQKRLQLEQDAEDREWDRIEAVLAPRILAAHGPVYVHGWASYPRSFRYDHVIQALGDACLVVASTIDPDDLVDPNPEPEEDLDDMLTTPSTRGGSVLVDVDELIAAIVDDDDEIL